MTVKVGNQLVPLRLLGGDAVPERLPAAPVEIFDFDAALLQAQADFRDISSQLSELEVRYRANQSALETERELRALADAEVERLLALKEQNLSADTAISAARSELGRRQLDPRHA